MSAGGALMTKVYMFLVQVVFQDTKFTIEHNMSVRSFNCLKIAKGNKNERDWKENTCTKFDTHSSAQDNQLSTASYKRLYVLNKDHF